MSDDLARQFHDTYERLAPEFGYRTREASAVPWEDVPEANRLLMEATVEAVVGARLRGAEAQRYRLLAAIDAFIAVNPTSSAGQMLRARAAEVRAEMEAQP